MILTHVAKDVKVQMIMDLVYILAAGMMVLLPLLEIMHLYGHLIQVLVLTLMESGVALIKH